MNAAQRPITSASTPAHSAVHADPARDSQSNAPLASSELGESSSVNPSTHRTSTHRKSGTQPKRKLHAGIRNAIAFESSVKLTVNLLLSIVATTTIAKLIPYHQAQQQRLSTLQESVVVAEEKNAELREQFSRNFDPAQAKHIMQEQSGMAYPNQKKVIWTAPLEKER